MPTLLSFPDGNIADQRLSPLDYANDRCVSVPTPDRNEAEQLFLDHLNTIEKIIRFVATKAQLRDADAEDFASHVKLRLIEKDYQIIRRWEGRGSFPMYLSTVIHRLLLDHRVQLWGKWHASSEAKRLGQVAITLELALVRDGRSMAEALPLCRRLDPTITMPALEALAARLPKRLPKTRLVPLETAHTELNIPADSVSHHTFEAESSLLASSTADAVRAAMSKLSEDEQLLLRLRFGADMSVANIARSLGREQKGLYRRINRALKQLRRRLEIAGIKAASIDDIIVGCGNSIDFGLGIENTEPRPSVTDGGKHENAEDRDDED